ncbi:IS4 family transposase [Actinoplanes auranticolor]|nr:IS4 family transposase [Actinoplanes auranticolor]
MVGVVPVSGGLTDWISVGLLASSVPRDVIDEAVAAYGRQAKRSDGKLPPHVMVYFVMAMALFADEDYEEVLTRLVEPLIRWGCWDPGWRMPGSSGLTQARQRLGFEPVQAVFAQVAVPVCELLTRGGWLGGRRLVSIDGFEWDVPDTQDNAVEFGRPGGVQHPAAFPKARVLTLVESGSHATIGATIGACVGEGSGEQSMARDLYRLLEAGMLVMADRNFYSYTGWETAAGTGADLLWRVSDSVELPTVAVLADGSHLALLFASRTTRAWRQRLLTAALAGEDLDPRRARLVRVVEYQVPDRGDADERQLVCLITTILDPGEVAAEVLAQGYHDRWEHENGNAQLKTSLRGPGRVLRSKSPDMVRQEIYGYLLTHYAISALICRAATEADIDPDRVKFLRTVRIVRRRITDPAAFSP